MPDKVDFKKTFESFKRLKILIVGDVMVDSYLWGKVERISPEAPVPVVSVNRRENRLGGAANVALNIKSLGATPILCSVIGVDGKGKDFLSLLKNEGISSEGIVQSASRITTTKFRVIGNHAHMLRVDEEMSDDLTKKDADNFLKKTFLIIEKEKIDAIIFQDYNKGVLTSYVIQQLIERANKLGIPTTVDPKKKNFDQYKKVTLFKPNLKELKEGLGIAIDNATIASLTHAAEQLHKKQLIEIVLITLSEKGVFVSSKSKNNTYKQVIIPAHIRSITDVSGAGDTVISTATLCLAIGLTPALLAAISNLAGGIVCEEIGVVSIDKNKLLKETLSSL